MQVTPDKPTLSVIVCTRDRKDALLACLAALEAACRGVHRECVEIVVVDNGSSDGTVQAVERFAESASVDLVIARETRRGLSMARNHAIQVSHGRLLAFTDDDCRVAPDYVTRLLSLFASDERPVLRGGRVELGDPADAPVTIQTAHGIVAWERSLASTRLRALGGGQLLGCNISMQREVIERIGGFDERLGPGQRIPAGEDADFVFRAYRAGFRVEYNDTIVVRHFHGRRRGAPIEDLLKGYAMGAGALYWKHNIHHPNFASKIARRGAKKVDAIEHGARHGNDLPAIPDISIGQKIAWALKGFISYPVAALLMGHRTSW